MRLFIVAMALVASPADQAYTLDQESDRTVVLIRSARTSDGDDLNLRFVSHFANSARDAWFTLTIAPKRDPMDRFAGVDEIVIDVGNGETARAAVLNERRDYLDCEVGRDQVGAISGAKSITVVMGKERCPLEPGAAELVRDLAARFVSMHPSRAKRPTPSPVHLPEFDRALRPDRSTDDPSLLAPLVPWIAGWAFVAAVSAAFGGWVAKQKGRKTTEGAILGGAFGFFGVLIEACLPQQG